MSRVVTYVEIDVPVCTLTHGVAPCAATGDVKCFNSFGTCQARQSWTQGTATVRLTEAREMDDMSIDALPCITDVSIQTTKISLGEDLGIRSAVTISMNDFRHSDIGPALDPYYAARDYDPYKHGTYWSRFKARHPFLRGRSMRVYRGELGKPLSDLEVRYYTINNVSGPDTNGKMTISAQDALKLADGDRAQAPRPSEGYLLSDMTTTTTVINLMPIGIGNLDYPASGLVSIGGSEICAFTRNGDTLTLTRGQRETLPDEHKSGDRVQLCLEYSGVNPANIINDLLVNYASVPAAMIPLSAWNTEVEANLRRLYTRTIAEPTPVRQLVSELVKQAALAIWFHDTANQIRLQVLKPTPVDAGVMSEDIYLKSKASVMDQPDKRISTCQVMYGLKNPLLDQEKPESYRSMALVSDIQGQSDYGSPAIEVVYGTWIPAYARQVATRLGALRVGRYATAPRRVTAEVHKKSPLIPVLGGGYYFTHWSIQDATGKQIQIPVQVTSVTDMDDKVKIEAEEATFLPIEEEDLTDRNITLDGNSLNLNLRSIHDSIYPEPGPDDKIRFIIPNGVLIGSRDVTLPALDTGVWPSNVIPSLESSGRIFGRGGRGGSTSSSGAGLPTTGGVGGVAMVVRSPIRFNNGGIVAGGGGGGGASGRGGNRGGSGGQGYFGGDGGFGYQGNNGQPGTAEAPGPGGDGGGSGGTIGNWGSASGGSPSSSGGAPGDAIRGNSLILFDNVGDIRGPRVG